MELTQALEAPPTGSRRRYDREAGTLTGSRCGGCGTSSWPGRAICHVCGSADVTWTNLAPKGRLVTKTTVWIARPGVPAPYTLGMIDLDDGVRVFAHLAEGEEGTPRVGDAVGIHFSDEGSEGPPFRFK
ncbi:MAG TPA: OB-fold domain-containing protein [Solirubrobacterales bacterium]|nr:OB-fold domain-containing protein [Solirubrobacterales bacterium]